jgi:hypothetical protein
MPLFSLATPLRPLAERDSGSAFGGEGVDLGGGLGGRTLCWVEWPGGARGLDDRIARVIFQRWPSLRARATLPPCRASLSKDW